MRYLMKPRLTALISAAVMLTLLCVTSVFIQGGHSKSANQGFGIVTSYSNDGERATVRKGIAEGDIIATSYKSGRGCDKLIETGTGTLCYPPDSLSIETGSVLKVRYFVPSGHCAPIKLHFYVDGILTYSTGFLGWLRENAPHNWVDWPLSTPLLDLGSAFQWNTGGTHTLKVQAEGLRDFGCFLEDGNSLGWGGTLVVLTSPTCSFPTSEPQPVVLEPAKQFQVGDLRSSMAVGKVNADENFDLVVPDVNNRDILVFLGKGNGDFENAKKIVVGGNIRFVALGNFNADDNRLYPK